MHAPACLHSRALLSRLVERDRESYCINLILIGIRVSTSHIQCGGDCVHFCGKAAPAFFVDSSKEQLGNGKCTSGYYVTEPRTKQVLAAVMQNFINAHDTLRW